ncbi:MAG: acetylglutamate kinase [Dehalococcoidia bacterium]|nr:acetylglutamate kinase [Dehalococcoidia bacterium]
MNPRSSVVIALGISFTYLGLISAGIGLYYAYLPAILLGLAAIALGAGLYFAASTRDANRQARALANLVFHEKVAIMSSYLGRQQNQIEHDRAAAVDFSRWADPSLREEFEELWQEFFERQGKILVIKIGGSTLGQHDTTLQDLVSLQKQGYLPVVVHGGGNRVTEWLKQMNISSSFVRGLRVTDERTLEVVIAVLAGLVNKELVAAINALGGKAIGLSGVDGGLIEGRIADPAMGYAGEVVRINPEPLGAVIGAGYIPVISPGGYRLPGDDGDPVMLLNINADTGASEIAAALKADRLIFLTNVAGIQNGDGKIVPRLSADEVRVMIESGVIKEGMIPKAEGCVRALNAVGFTQIIDGRVPGALLAAAQNGYGGTRIE